MFAKTDGDGTISPFQAATSALASTIGASNIIGVPLAVATGGPGAIFWMWLIALFGCALKYSEIILGIKYRVKNEEGEYVGGPMYYIRDGLRLPWLGSLFAFFLMIEIAPSIASTISIFCSKCRNYKYSTYCIWNIISSICRFCSIWWYKKE